VKSTFCAGKAGIKTGMLGRSMADDYFQILSFMKMKFEKASKILVALLNLLAAILMVLAQLS
jgi:hypothetical protein